MGKFTQNYAFFALNVYLSTRKHTSFAKSSKFNFKVSVAGCDMLRTFGLGEADLQPCIDR